MNGTPPGRGWRHCMTLPRSCRSATMARSDRPGRPIAEEIAWRTAVSNRRRNRHRRADNPIQGDAFEERLAVELGRASGISVKLPRSSGAKDITLAIKDKYVELQGASEPTCNWQKTAQPSSRCTSITPSSSSTLMAGPASRAIPTPRGRHGAVAQNPNRRRNRDGQESSRLADYVVLDSRIGRRELGDFRGNRISQPSGL